MQLAKPFWKFTSLLFLVTVLLMFATFLQKPVLADDNKDYVIVIDISTSMQDIFQEVKDLAVRTIEKAQDGDNVTIITFGEQTTLLDRKLIRGKADKEALQAEVNALYPTDYATYINQGLEKSLSELRYLFEKSPDRERVMLWLSDDKDNPPEALGKDVLTLDQMREENRNFQPGNEWFAYDAPLSEVKNESVEDFLTWARRTTFRVAVKEPSVDLGGFEEDNVKKNVVLTFEPKHPGAQGLKFDVEARLTDPTDPSKSIPVTVSPTSVVASGTPWEQKFQIAFAGQPGQYQGDLIFKSVAGSSLDVEPRMVPFSASIIPPKLAAVEPEPPAEPATPEAILDQVASAEEKRPAGTTRIDKPYSFGPLDPGSKDTKIITLVLNKETDPKDITFDSSIALPEGVKISSDVIGKGTRLAAEITVEVDRNIQLPQDYALQEAYEGSLRFKSSDPQVEVLPVYVPIRVAFNTGDKVRWGKKMLPKQEVGQFKARQMTFDELAKELEGTEKKEETAGPLSPVRRVLSLFLVRGVFYPILAAIALVIILLLYRMRPASELFVGELVVIKDPSGSNMKNVNLKRIGSLHSKDILTVGSSPKADVRLGHGTVAPVHCRLSAKTSQNRTQVSIQPAKGASVRVNDVELTAKTPLSDKDLIGIGDFILLFSHPEAQKEVVVHFHDGRTMRGSPVTWDIGSNSFELLRSGDGGIEGTSEEIAVVNFTELKAVFFLQDASGGTTGMPADRINTAEVLEVVFFDGEKVEGNPLTDYTDVSARFYLVPKEMPNIESILVERRSVRDIVKRKSLGEAEHARSATAKSLMRRHRDAESSE